MKYISFSLVLSIICGCYVIHTIWTLAELFIPPECNRGERCYSNYLSSKPVQNLYLYSSVNENPYTDTYSADPVHKIHSVRKFNYEEPTSFHVNLPIPARTRNNGTLFLHAVLLDTKHSYSNFLDIKQAEAVHTLPLITYTEPQETAFNLLQQKTLDVKKPKDIKPYAHIKTFVPLSVFIADIKLPVNRIPGEIYYALRIRKGKFLPIIQHNVLKSRMSHLELLNSTTKSVNITFAVSPASYGTLRLALHVRLALEHLKALGFGEKDVDDVKGIFDDTNIYLLSATVFIGSCHLLFDFLAFKHDVSFWRKKRTLAGLSARTLLWRAFSQCVIFMYLLDEKTSLLVLIPSGISVIIELWKVRKVITVSVSARGVSVRMRHEAGDAERATAAADAEAMRYLVMLLYPLCAGGAVYSLLYVQHKSWYSWALNSLVNGVYAFGFLFMLPQLFVNYRLRSVAALPWRAFMYKAFNTFIDDVFAFIITMPTAHRVACFRDDLVFLVYLYQRWLYPVDKTRTDTGASMEETTEVTKEVKDKKE